MARRKTVRDAAMAATVGEMEHLNRLQREYWDQCRLFQQGLREALDDAHDKGEDPRLAVKSVIRKARVK